jgi:hypothetical protein
MAAAVVLVGGMAEGMGAQPDPQPDSQPNTQPDRPPEAVSEQIRLQPEIAIGVRVEMVRRGLPVAPVVVIVPNVRSYVAAIDGWRLSMRYPVLIDDRSARAAEDIGRFVRAFEPEQVVRWRLDEARNADVWDVESACMAALCSAWGVTADEEKSLDTLKAKWAAIGFAPPGVVVASEDDDAWVAGLALAAGRGQPIVWVNGLPKGVNRASTKPIVEAIVRRIEAGIEETGYPWRELGDVIETVTLCANLPVRYAVDGKDEAALTDRVGRTGGGVQRWGWSGQVFGNASQASYRAMCSLYLPVRKAWLFDGYSMDGAWGQYDLTRAGEVFKAGGIETAVLDTPNQSETVWRTAASRPLDTDLILVNSSGNRNWFDLKPGRCSPGDLPILSRPAMMHMVHSWSAVTPGRATTVAGRWLERGVYAYAGSVQEPYLSAFEPGEMIAQRLLAPAPFGVAVRRKGMRLWKVAVLGDPLLTVGPPATRVEDEPLLKGGEAITERLARLLKQKRYADAARVLVMLGRDGDVVRLATAVARDEPQAYDEKLAAAVVFPAFREGNIEVLVEAFAYLSENVAQRDSRQDALWNALWPSLSGAIASDRVGLLERNIRADNVARDSVALAPAMRRAFGRDRARSMLMAAKARATDKRSQKLLEKALSGRE